MVLESFRVAVELVEVLHQILGTRPHIHGVRRVAKVVRQTTAKVARTEDEDLGLVAVLLVGEHLEAGGRYEAGSEPYVRESCRQRWWATSREP